MPPQKLFDLCLDFVSQNVKHVESFEYIPDVVGKQIFKRTIQLEESGERFCLEAKTLKLLVCAYGADLLTSLSLVNQRDILDKYSERFDALLDCKGLVSLDLGSCSLDDDHPILKIIARLKRLKNLGLSHNLISGAGLRCLTTPVRMLKDGPVELTSLDLAGNLQINDSSIRFLLAFKEIKFLDLSDNFISNEGVTSLCESLHLTAMKDDRRFVEINTSGWASPLIHVWLQEKPELTTQIKHFYGDPYGKRGHIKRRSQIQVSRKVRLIAASFNKTDHNAWDSGSVQVQTCQHSVKHIENLEKRGIIADEDSDDCRRKKKRKLNEFISSSYSLPHKDHPSFRHTSIKILKKGKPKVKNENIDEKVPMELKKKIRDNAGSKNTLLSALDQVQYDSCEYASCNKKNLKKGDKRAETSSQPDSATNIDARNTPTNQLKPLPIKKFKLKKK